ncbi:RDD family protein [Nocardioides antri]|uniref:RDD family protein n=2 Tax=Nocardioides antri TaxID=2607659 RepID=A0A5B1M6D7_9ACTN|nr:RDD family protein [Nocardioides antri]
MPPEPPGPPTPPPGGPTPPPGGPTPPPTGGLPGSHPVGVEKPGELLNRFLARLIDHILLGVVYVPIFLILSAIIYSGFSNSFGEQFIFYTLTAILQAALYLAYFTLLESNRGQTVGKMILKLRTYGPDGVSNPTVEQAAKRNAYSALGVLSIIPIIGWFFLGWAAPLAAMIFIAVTLNKDPNRQGWHDKFAGGTQVKQLG